VIRYKIEQYIGWKIICLLFVQCFQTLQVAEKSGFQLLNTKPIFNHFHLKTPKNNPINLNKCFYSLKIVKTQLQIKKQPEITKLSNFYNKMKGINHHH
jgi:hypothetical protein